MEFCDKLVYVMTELNIKSVTLARKIPVDPALVSHWRTGRRALKDKEMIDRVAECVVESARTDKEKDFLDMLLSDYDDERLSAAQKVSRWLFDGRGIRSMSEIRAPRPVGMCFSGTDGFFTAVSMLEYSLCRRISGAGITVYISAEHMDLIPRVGSVWQRLYRLNRAPVPVILEQSLDSERLSEVLAALLPHMQSGYLRLRHIPSARRQICYNLVVVARGVGMVMAMEPPGGRDAVVTMFVDRQSFVEGVGSKLEEIGAASLPMFERLTELSDENSLTERCFETGTPMLAQFGTVNLLYADPAEYRLLLESNGITGEAAQRETAEFDRMRRAFMDFLDSGSYKEIVSLTVIDRLSRPVPNTLPDLRMLGGGAVQFPDRFIRSLLRGMTEFVSQYPALELVLTRAGRDGQVLRIKEDCFLLLQSMSEGRTVSFGSENWLVVNEYSKDFRTRWNSGGEVFGRGNVVYSLDRLICRLEAQDEI